MMIGYTFSNVSASAVTGVREHMLRIAPKLVANSPKPLRHNKSSEHSSESEGVANGVGRIRGVVMETALATFVA